LGLELAISPYSFGPFLTPKRGFLYGEMAVLGAKFNLHAHVKEKWPVDGTSRDAHYRSI